MLTSFSLFPQITLPTTFNTCTGTLIDNFFCNLTKRVLESTAGKLINTFSDHLPYFMFKDTTGLFYNIHIQNYIYSSEIYKQMDTNPNTVPNHNYYIIINEITKAKNKYMTSSKLVTFKTYKHKKSTWITQGLLISIRYRDKLYKPLQITNP